MLFVCSCCTYIAHTLQETNQRLLISMSDSVEVDLELSTSLDPCNSALKKVV